MNSASPVLSALKSGRSARFSLDDEDDSRATVPCFAIPAGEPVKQAAVRMPSVGDPGLLVLLEQIVERLDREVLHGAVLLEGEHAQLPMGGGVGNGTMGR